MSIFRRPDYQSDATQFINQLKATKPELDKQQQAGRALLWDKQVDRQLWNDYRQARVAQKPLRLPDQRGLSLALPAFAMKLFLALDQQAPAAIYFIAT